MFKHIAHVPSNMSCTHLIVTPMFMVSDTNTML